MRPALKHLLCLLTIVAYVFAYMGFGVHTCHNDGSRQFVWMYGEVSCERIHHHDHGADCDDCHHDGRCCSTQVYVLTDAQNPAPGIDRISAPELLSVLPGPVLFLPVLSGHRPLFAFDSPPPEAPRPQSLLSVWRV